VNVQPAAAGASRERLRLWLRLLRAVRRVEGELREELRLAFATTLPRFDVLAMLERSREGLRMSELSDRLMVSNGNVTGIVDRLVAEGLVERLAVAGDRRATRVRLTAGGSRDFAAMAEAHEGWVDRLFGGLSPEEARSLGDLLQRIGREPA
jgi:DNA-binding MarR family transcriptional regulator